jgi:hypothetical protein
MATQATSNTYLESKALNSYFGYNISATSPLNHSSLGNPNSSINTTVDLNKTVTENNYFPAPTTYVDYDLTTYKHARQIESLYWSSKNHLGYLQDKKSLSLTPQYEDYYKGNLSLTTQLVDRHSLKMFNNFGLTLGQVPSTYATSNTTFYNPALSTPNDYNTLFSKIFSSK